MTRGAFWLLAPVIVSAAVLFVLRGGEIERADYFFFQVMGLAILCWVALGVARAVAIRRLKSP